MPREVLPSEEEVRAAIRYAQESGAIVNIVKFWPWADFPRKPDEGTRAEMTAHGWGWSGRKRRWYLRTTESGRYRRATYADLVARHGERPAPDLTEERDAAPAGLLA